MKAQAPLQLSKAAVPWSLSLIHIYLASVKFVDRIGYRASAVLAHGLSAAGLVLLTVLPEVAPTPFLGLLGAVLVYAMGGGLLEVLISPIVEACPTPNKAGAMSLLHSFYCWGHVGVVLLSTAFFTLFGVDNWKVMALLWALIPPVSYTHLDVYKRQGLGPATNRVP